MEPANESGVCNAYTKKEKKEKHARETEGGGISQQHTGAVQGVRVQQPKGH